MRTSSTPLVFIAALLLAVAAHAQQASKPLIVWHDAEKLLMEGKGWSDTKTFYDRLPARAEKLVRAPVWNLSQNSAGMYVRFATDSEVIWARWTLRSEQLDMPHMSAAGVSGLDLYLKENGEWRWTGAGRPKQVASNEVVVAKSRTSRHRDYLLYLPLYNGVKSLEIGVSANAKFESSPAPAKKPIVFYGTSIQQGACASRPGMAYPAILGRHLDWPVINLGFSGNARSEPEIAQLLAELDPSIYVLDPLPNMDAAAVAERIEPLVKTLRAAHPTTPIVLVENIQYADDHFVETRRERSSTSNKALKEIYDRLKKSGEKDLYYITGEKLLGSDREGTVDGTHPNDLGFMRMAEAMKPTLKRALKVSTRRKD